MQIGWGYYEMIFDCLSDSPLVTTSKHIGNEEPISYPLWCVSINRFHVQECKIPSTIIFFVIPR